MHRAVLLIGLTLALTACESEAEKDRKSKADYAAYTAGICREALGNVAMVENVRSAMNKPQRDEGGRGFANIVCKEAAKAAIADANARLNDQLGNRN